MHKLIHHPLCAFSRSIRLALGECGAVVELAEERPWAWRREFLEINPSGATPVLMTEGGVAVCGVYAVAEYLAESSPPPGAVSPRTVLFPGSIEERAEVRRLSDWFHRKFFDEVTQYLVEEKVFGAMAGRGAADPSFFRAGRENLRYHLSYITFLAEQRRWLAGANLSYADFAAAGHLSALDYLGEAPWDEFGPAKDWFARLKSRPAFRALLADRVAGLPPHAAYANLDF